VASPFGFELASFWVHHKLAALLHKVFRPCGGAMDFATYETNQGFDLFVVVAVSCEITHRASVDALSRQRKTADFRQPHGFLYAGQATSPSCISWEAVFASVLHDLVMGRFLATQVMQEVYSVVGAVPAFFERAREEGQANSLVDILQGDVRIGPAGRSCWAISQMLPELIARIRSSVLLCWVQVVLASPNIQEPVSAQACGFMSFFF